jgi:predicted acylesterase/phospholipase RssA
MPLLTRLKNKTIKICTMSNITIPESQRAVVFQGGGSLGAYEAGVEEELKDKGKENGESNNEILGRFARKTY